MMPNPHVVRTLLLLLAGGLAGALIIVAGCQENATSDQDGGPPANAKLVTIDVTGMF